MDTNILMRFAHKDIATQRLLQRESKHFERYAVSILTNIELFSLLSDAIIREIDAFLCSIQTIHLNDEIARKTIQIRRAYEVKTVDAIIAATAVVLGLPLISYDSVFKKIRGLRLIGS